MTSEDFVRRFLGLFPDENHNQVGREYTYKLINRIKLQRYFLGISSITWRDC